MKNKNNNNKNARKSAINNNNQKLVKKMKELKAAESSPTAVGKLLRSLGSVAGGGLGAFLGGPAGRVAGTSIGQEAGAVVSKIFGQGAYKIQQNSLLSAVDAGVPVMHSESETIRFRHREFIANVSSSTSFVTTTYSVNPGLPSTFPFLSAIAQNFQEYDFKGLVFEFKSTSADALNSTNTALGTIILAAQYRADAPAFTNKQQMLNEMWSIDGKPSDCRLLPIECDPKENPFNVQYVRTTAISSGDIKMYDIANLVVGSVGSQAVAVVGELWATYDVELRKPQLSSGLDLAGLYAYYTATSYTAALFGVSPTKSFDSIGLSLAANAITFPVGCQGLYVINCLWVGTSAAFTAPTRAYVNMAEVYFWAAPSSGVENGTNVMIRILVRITDPTAISSLTLSGGGLPTSGTDMEFMVTQVNNGATK